MSHLSSVESFLTAVFICCTVSSSAEADNSKSWLRRAESAVDRISDGEAADLTFTRLLEVYIQRGETGDAEKTAKQIRSREHRLRAHISIARHYAEAGDVDRCRLELEQAQPLASPTRLPGEELLEACLHLAESPPLAISFMSREQDDPDRARMKLCQALTRHGYLNQAITIAAGESDAGKQNALQLTIAIAAARAARIADTEKAAKNLTVSSLARQRVWSALAAALYRKNDLQSARLYADRVNSSRIKQTDEFLIRIDRKIPPGTLTFRTYHSERTEKELPLTVPLPSGDPDEARRLLEEIIAGAKASPMKPSQGQFGPWNQNGHLARIRLQHGFVAALYRKAGKDKQAAGQMQLAERALVTLINENAWAGSFALRELQHVLASLNDTQGLIRLIDLQSEIARTSSEPRVTSPPLVAEAVVPSLLSSGDIERAEQIASSALSRQSVWNSRGSRRSQIVACFINAGKLKPARDILKSSVPGEFTAAACENAGRALVRQDHRLLMQPEWQNDIGAFQRAHLYVGAALMVRENSKTD